jgi:hypothetical protein
VDYTQDGAPSPVSLFTPRSRDEGDEEALFDGLEEQDRAELRLLLEEEKALLAQEKMLEEKLKKQLDEESRASDNRGSPIPVDSTASGY